jgi:hypothetical protein
VGLLPGKADEEANRRIGAARAAFKQALALADSGAQRRAVSVASTGFDRWVEVVHGEFVSFQQGNKNGAIEAKKSSVAAESTRCLRIMLGCALGALVVGGADARLLEEAGIAGRLRLLGLASFGRSTGS